MNAFWIHGSQGQMIGAKHSGRKSENRRTKFRNILRSGGILNLPDIKNGIIPGNHINLGATTATQLISHHGSHYFVWDNGSKITVKMPNFM